MLPVSDVRFSNQSGSSAGEKESDIRKAASANKTPIDSGRVSSF